MVIKKKIIISGDTGKCGQSLINLLKNYDYFDFLAGINSKTNLNNIENFIQECDIIIDFSHNKFTLKLAQLAQQLKKPLVIGTTGIQATQFIQLQQISTQIPIFYTSNFSIAIHALHNCIQTLNKTFGNDYEKFIIDLHHKHKKDSPSGTAIYLQSAIPEANILSYKGGEVIGVHTVEFIGNLDIIELKHTALQRELFTFNSLKIAQWMLETKLPTGFYTMQDYLKFIQSKQEIKHTNEK